MIYTIRLTHRIRHGYGYTIQDFSGTLEQLKKKFAMSCRLYGKDPKTASELVRIINIIDCRLGASRLRDQLTEKNPDIYTLLAN